MTIIEQLINEVSVLETAIKDAAATKRLSGTSAKVLKEECIRMLVAMQYNHILRAQTIEAQRAVVAPAPIVTPS